MMENSPIPIPSPPTASANSAHPGELLMRGFDKKAWSEGCSKSLSGGGGAFTSRAWFGLRRSHCAHSAAEASPLQRKIVCQERLGCCCQDLADVAMCSEKLIAGAIRDLATTVLRPLNARLIHNRLGYSTPCGRCAASVKRIFHEVLAGRETGCLQFLPIAPPPHRTD
jgi:hypothetical protein